MPTNVAAMKSMVDQGTTEVRWGGGWRGGGFGYRGIGFRGGGWGYRGGLGYRGWGYRGLGYGVAAGAIVGGAIASRSYYGGYGGYYGGYPAYSSYAATPYYGYGGGYGMAAVRRGRHRSRTGRIPTNALTWSGLAWAGPTSPSASWK